MKKQSNQHRATWRLWTAAGAAAGLSVIAAAVMALHGSPAEATANSAPSAPVVSVATVGETDITSWDEFSGRLEAVERVDVRSRVAGAVHAVHFREGALVRQGELLVTIDPAPYAAEAERAEAQVAAAQARQAQAASEHTRAKRLWEESAIAQRELEERANAEREAAANLRAALAQLQAARLNLGYTQVRAPVAGRIGKLEVTVGNLVAAGPGAPVLTTLVSVSPMYASFEADEQVILRALKELPGGASARSLIERIPVQMGTSTMSDTPYRGRLQLIVRAAFDNQDGALMPGQFARVRMGQAQTKRALLVSERAVGTDQEKKYVLVVGGGNTAEYREVTLGPSSNGLRVVLSGLKPGERIVVNGLQRVRPGSPVQPQLVSMEAKA